MRPYYMQIRNQKQEVIEELIDYLALDDNRARRKNYSGNKIY